MGKKDNIHLVSSAGAITIYAQYAKAFLSIADKYEYDECGVAFKKTDGVESFIQFDTPQIAIDSYKKVVNMIELNEVDRIKMEKSLLNKLKEDVFKFQPTFYATALAFWMLYGEKDAKYAIYLISLVALGSIDFTEAFRLMKAYLITKDKRAVLDVDLCELGLSEYVDQTESKKDASLYLKLSSDFVKKK